jgi:O-antigen/teichoic acid export membrane protein
LIAVNRHQTLAGIYTVATALSLGIALVLTHLLGLPGAALGLLVIDVYMCSYVVGRSLALVKDTPAEFFRYVLKPPVADLIKLRIRWPAREQKTSA